MVPTVSCFSQSVDPNVERLELARDAKAWPGAAELVVYDSSDVDVKETGLSYVIQHRLVKALTVAGARGMRTVTFDYDPLSAAVEVRLARIYRKNGSVETVPAERVYDYAAPARAIYWGARQKMVEFGALEPGDAVETVVFRKGFTYALLANDEDDKFIPPMKGHFYDIVEFWSSVPMMEKVYRIAVPKNKPLQYEVYNGELTSWVHFAPEQKHKIRLVTNPQMKQGETPDMPPFYSVDGKIVYCWSKRNMQVYRGEPGAGAPSDNATKLLLSTAPDWFSKAVWFNRVNEDFKSFEVTPEVKRITDSLLKGESGEMARISILTHWAAEQIRYSGISMGTGEGYTLHPGSMTFRDRCGVCKDKAGMLITLLRAAGFESYPAMTMAGSRIDRIPADQFNHSVTLVKLSGGEWMLLDPTWVPAVRELWSSAEQQQQFLPGIPGGADIMTTPVSPADNHYFRLEGKSALDEDGTLSGEMTLTAEGQSDAAIRRNFARSFRSGWGGYIPGAMAGVNPRTEIIEYTFSDPDDLSKPMSIYVKYRIPRYAAVSKEKVIFVPLLARNPFNDRTVSSELYMDTSLVTRKQGFSTRCSKVVEVKETITLPKFARIETDNKFKTIRGPASAFEATYALSGNVLKVKMTHRMEKRLYDAGDWQLFRDCLVARLKFAETPIILSK
jgi:hypothetical protein